MFHRCAIALFIATAHAQETTSPHLRDPGSFTLRAGPEADAPLFARGVDYEVDLEWGTFGRLAEGHIAPDAAVFASYRHAQLRLDAIVLMPDGQIQLRPGEPRAAAPAVPRLHAGERHLGNIYLPGFITKLEPDHLFIALFGPALIYSNHSECSPAHGAGRGAHFTAGHAAGQTRSKRRARPCAETAYFVRG